ncbi:Kelch repeat-containing protein-like protein 5 [Colletotrichum chlorophyti]|uniref:Kelch repeat-containing protein-like protein 5 n=1 Tax=Colletotrichum chlorophyti TaxID=708187 RepID=A0A1Q8RNL5_9PEZI|nr:Kelch repeat-containing protein-like protein 5 [Colletotrichum chlorophyti]
MKPSPVRQEEAGPGLRRRVVEKEPGMRPTAAPAPLLFVLLAISLFPALAAAQQDPVKDFCRRFGHQTAVVDNKLYIYGGLINWNPISSFPNNYTNTWLLYQDLSTTSKSDMPQLYANLSKNGSVPSTAGGALWADSVNKRFYLFGGEHRSEPPMPFNLYGYDIINNQWDSFGPPRTGGTFSKVSYGAGVSVDTRGEAYYYGGWLSNASVPGWGTGPPVATTGLVKYTMDQNSWANITGPDDTRRAEGSLHYIPAGDGGMLVYFGGVQDPYANGTTTGQPMDQIFIYDVLSGKWYTQKATGKVPEMRRRFCADVTWAQDQSSYNIYMYGGANIPGELGAGFDDLYVLTIPTFTWVKMYPSDLNKTGSYPHHSLSCNMAPGRAQMLIIGGQFPLSQDCDAFEQWGTHNVDLGKQNRAKNIWYAYQPNKTTYVVPEEIIAVVGGNGNGSATKTTPLNGFDNDDVHLLITLKADIPVRTPTRVVTTDTSAPVKVLSTGAIVGIAVGAGVLIIALAMGCGFLILQSYPPQQAYFPEGMTMTLSHQPQYDAHGNIWVPQVSMVQVASGQGVSPPLPPGYSPPAGDSKSIPQTAEAQIEPQELSADRDDHGGSSVRHETYYNK